MNTAHDATFEEWQAAAHCLKDIVLLKDTKKQKAALLKNFFLLKSFLTVEQAAGHETYTYFSSRTHDLISQKSSLQSKLLTR